MKRLFLITLLIGLPALAQLPDAPREKKDNFKTFITSKDTMTQFALVGGSFAWDGLSTQAKFGWPARLPDSLHTERNPFVKRSRPATSMYFAGSFGAYVGTSYLLRRHTRIRWIATSGLLVVQAFAIRSNYSAINFAKVSQRSCLATPDVIACPR